MPRGHGVGLFAGQAGVWWSSRSFCRSCPHRGFSEAVAASFQAAAPSGLGPPMQQTIGGVPFMCYKDDEAAASVTAREQVCVLPAPRRSSRLRDWPALARGPQTRSPCCSACLARRPAARPAR
ncbi:unnamed protein product, partial [Prorocentrum cordatum]